MTELLYIAACIAFFVFAFVTLFFIRNHPVKISFIASLLFTSLWAGASASGPSLLWHYLELTRDLSWLWLCVHLLNPSLKWSYLDEQLRRIIIFFGGAFLCLLCIDIYSVFNLQQDLIHSLFTLWSYEYLLLSVAGLILIEQLLRNADAELLWAVKLLSIVIAVQFVYDMVLYSSSLLSNNLNLHLWNARAAFILLLIPMTWISMRRLTNRKSKIVISRHIAFHGLSLVGIGLYLLVMSAIAYYLQFSNIVWGPLIQIVFLCIALLALMIMAFSGQVRGKIKVYVNKHFFDYKYDYRDEWLRFSNSFSVSKDDSSLDERIILSIANIIDSTGGLLWVKDGDEYVCRASLNHELLPMLSDASEGNVVAFLEESGWVIDTREYKSDPEKYEWLMLPDWLFHDNDIRLLIPIVYQEESLAILALNQPRADRDFNWEDRDLLKTVAQQSAGYLTLMNLSQELHDARQFEAFNRLSAYVVHDLKNVVAQLSLVVSNGQKYRSNPDFVDDAFDTVGNAVTKMEKMLTHLRHDRSDSVSIETKVNIYIILEKVIQLRQVELPKVTLKTLSGNAIYISADTERLCDVLLHLVQNAQEATADDGKVELTLSLEGIYAQIEICDTGCGMSAEFVHHQLFKPFSTTKGNAGMGIGVYEAKEYIQNINGTLRVESEENIGSRFYVRLPLLTEK